MFQVRLNIFSRYFRELPTGAINDDGHGWIFNVVGIEDPERKKPISVMQTIRSE